MTYENIPNRAALEIKKINNTGGKGTLTSKFKHNYRKEKVLNADDERGKYNEEMVEEYDIRKTGELDYVQRFNKRINELEYYKDHDIRSNGVIAYEINMTYSPTAKVPLEEWKKENYQWLKDEFNVAPDKKNNILSCVFHGDENNPHIHAIVMPVDERGQLCASRFTDGYSSMVQKQDSYAERMSKFGLERGTKGSTMEHQQVRKFYADANKVLKDTPKPKEHETAQEYYDRYREQLETIYASQTMRAAKAAEERKRQSDAYAVQRRQEIKSTYAQHEETYKRQKNEIHALYKDIDKKQKSISEMMEKAVKERDALYVEIDELERQKKKSDNGEIQEKIKFHDDFFRHYHILQEKEPEKAEQLDNLLLDMDMLDVEIPEKGE